MRKCPFCAEEIQTEAVRCRYCHVWLAPPPEKTFSPLAKRLTRSQTDRMLTGVCGGIAHYLDLDVTIVRVFCVLLICLSAFIPGLVAYVVLSFVIPKTADA